MSSLLLKNIGTLVTGDFEQPLGETNSIYIEDGLITQIGRGLTKPADQTIDCLGTTVAPGLFDTHCHLMFGDFTPRQNQLGFLESAHHGGVTTFISAGEIHLPGQPTIDPAGAKALALLAHKSFQNFRPGGAKVLGGTLIMEKGLKEVDFRELVAEGIRLVGEVGLGSIRSPEETAPLVAWAQAHGLTVRMRAGGPSVPGSGPVTADMVIAAKPDVVSHLNGGPTAIAPAEIKKLIHETDFWLEVVHCGNNKAALFALNEAREAGALHRFIIGNDAPSGTGVISLGILRMVCHLAALGGLEPALALALATGNPAKAYRLNRGLIAEGREADLVIMDSPVGSVGHDALTALSAGDLPAVSLVLVDGRITVNGSRNTPPPMLRPVVQ